MGTERTGIVRQRLIGNVLIGRSGTEHLIEFVTSRRVWKCYGFARHLAGHFHVAAKRQKTNFVIGVAVLDAEEAGTKAHGERFDADATQLGHGEMAKLVDHDHDANQNDEG
jgi:hypothetical protein